MSVAWTKNTVMTPSTTAVRAVLAGGMGSFKFKWWDLVLLKAEHYIVCFITTCAKQDYKLMGGHRKRNGEA